MLIAKDRIKELTSTTGAGTLTLTGAEAGFQAFSVLGNTRKCYYSLTDVNGTDWEVGEGTYNSNTLTRDVVLESSNSGTAISLSATGSTVFVTYPSNYASYSNVGVNRDYVSSGNIASGKPLILNTDGTVTQVASGNLTKTNYIGLANATVVSGESVPVNQVGSYNNLQSSLVTGADYYCTDAGDISLRTSSGTVLATQFIGTARSSTDLQLLNPPSEIVGYSDGAITKGKAVIINSTDGHFKQVVGTGSSGSEIRPLVPYEIDTSTTFNAPLSICTASDGDGTTAVMWLDSNEYPNVCIGTTNSSGVQTWGTPYVPMSSAVKSQSCGIAWSSKFNTDYGNLGGFVITFFVMSAGSYGEFHNYAIQFSTLNNLGLQGEASRGPNTGYTSGTQIISNSYDNGLGRINVLVFKPWGFMYSVLTRTFTSSLSVGEETFPHSSNYTSDIQYGNQVFDNTNNRGIIAFRDEGNSDLPTVIAYSTSTAYPYYTYGTAKVLDTSSCVNINVAEGEADGNGTVVAWNNGGTSAYKYCTLSFSGLTVSNTTPSTFESSAVLDTYQNLIYNTVSEKYTAVYEDGNSNAYIRNGTYSSGSVTWSSAVLVDNNRTWNSLFISPNSGNGAMSIISGQTSTNSYPTAISYAPAYNNTATPLTTANYLGVASETVADNTDVKVNAYGIDPTQTGLTINTDYYVDNTTGSATSTAGPVSVKIGKAISTTEILID